MTTIFIIHGVGGHPEENCPKFFVFHANNDPYVPLQKAAELAAKLGVKATIVKKAGHFNSNSGYRSFKLLLKKIKTELNKKEK